MPNAGRWELVAAAGAHLTESVCVCVCVFVCAMIIYSQFYVCCYIVRESHSAGAELIKGVEFSKPIFLNGKFTTEAF